MQSIRNRAAALLASAACSAFIAAAAQGAELLDRAVLPSASFSSGPTSGQFANGANGVVMPFIAK
jgi:hypothetical protein